MKSILLFGALILVGTVTFLLGAIDWYGKYRHVRYAKNNMDEIAVEKVETIQPTHANRTNPSDPYRPYVPNAPTHSMSQSTSSIPIGLSRLQSAQKSYTENLPMLAGLVIGGGLMVTFGCLGLYRQIAARRAGSIETG